jgi:Tfp pilus assembly PilM family ATPase
MYYAAIHISSNNIVTYLEMKKKGEDLLPVAHERIHFVRVLEEDTADLIKVLSQLHEKHKVDFVKISVPESKSYLFEVEIPKVDDSELHDAVAFNIEEKAPVSLTDVVFGYRVINDTGPETESVSVSVVPEKLVSDYIQICSEAGMCPVSMKVEAQAVANAVIPKDAKGNYIIVSIKESKTIIAIVENGGVFLSATVDFRGLAFDLIIEKHFPDLKSEERKVIKMTKRFITDSDNEKVHMEFLEQVTLLKNYMNKYYIYWLTHKGAGGEVSSKTLDSFIIVGNTACIPGLIEYLNSQLKAPVAPGNVWTNCFKSDDYIPEIPYDESFEYAEAVGLLVGKD